MSAPAVSLSNRRETTPKNGGRARVGIDRLSLSFALEALEHDTSAWSSLKVRNPGTEHARTTYGTSIDGVFVGAQQHPAEPQIWIGKLEFNPSRAIDPDGWESCPLDRLQEAIGLAGSKVTELVRPAGDIASSRVKRLDVCRDFVTEHPASIVRGLGPVHRPWAKRNLIHFDPSRNGAQTLMVGSGAGVVRLYDKHAEKAQAPEGTLRWEVEARAGWLDKYGGVKQLGDITETSVEALAQNRWDWSGMDRELSGTEQVVDKVMRLHASPAVKRGLIGHLVMESTGCSYKLSNDAASRYRKLAKQAGIVVAPEGVTGASMRLDWESATEITEVGF